EMRHVQGGSCGLFRHIAGQPVGAPGFRAALAGRAEAATTGGLEDQPPPGRDMLPALGTQDRAVVECDYTGGTIRPAVAPLGRMVDPVEHGREVEFVAVPSLDLDDLAEAASLPPVAPGIRTQLLPPNDDWTGLLSRFDRHRVDAGREGGGGHSVLRRSGA